MTKEIIIDGVDVAGCEYFNKVTYEEPYCNIDEEHLYTCSSDENCYYKQLQRVKAENEKLKKQYNCYACGGCKGKEDYINLEKHHKGLRKQFDKFWNTLQEIKEIAEIGMHCEGVGCDFMPKILALITKAESEG